MLVVADTSALVALAACDALSLLDQLFQDVRVPTAVLRECTVPGKPEAERLQGYLRGRVVEVVLKEFVIAVAGLGEGELEAMALYKRLHADFLLVDDHRARKVARLNGIEVVGSLGILLRAKESGLVPKIRPLLAAIQAAGVHYSEHLVDEALRLADER
jgi:predicted nucleic acid-binding protein